MHALLESLGASCY